jgi:ribosomal protein L11 methyltransferase
VPADVAEEARARMLDLSPEGFEERDLADGGVELAAYVDEAGAARIGAAFRSAAATPIAADWQTRWRRFHRPVRIGPLWVGPPWATAPPDATAVVVDPGQAFGTGAHATTRLCLELLLELEPASLLDVGCGSGVLSIAAAKLGFGPVLAVDHDPAAIDATAANAAANGVDMGVVAADALAGPLPSVAVVVANVSLEAVLRLSGRLDAERVITSGYLEDEEPRLDGFEPLRRRTLDGWAADLHARTQ